MSKEEFESYGIFDLRSLGDVDKKVSREVLLKKIKMDKLREDLNKINVYKMRLKSIK